MARLPRPVTKISSVMPAAMASSTAYWMSGLSTTGSISLGLALVAGRNRVPRPATGNTALRTAMVLKISPSLIGQADQAGKRIEKFIEKYSTYSDEEKRDIIFIYGNSDSLRGVSYQELVTGSISIGIDQAVSISGTIPVDIESKISEKKITVNFKGTDDTTEIPYEFKIKPGENFYFVVIQDVGDERVVIQSE